MWIHTEPEDHKLDREIFLQSGLERKMNIWQKKNLNSSFNQKIKTWKNPELWFKQKYSNLKGKKSWATV